MEENTPTPLEDPQLKAALKSAMGGHRASDQLRMRVKAAMASAPEAPAPIEFPRRNSNSMRWVLAIAALVAITAGLLLLNVNRMTQMPESDPNYHLLDEMVDAHKDWNAKSPEVEVIASLADHSIPSPGDEAAKTKLASVLKDRLNRFVPLPDFASQGWELEAVALQKIDGKQAAHFILSRGTRKISVFSFDQSALTKPFTNDVYQTKLDDFPMAGVVKWNGLHCVVCPVEMKLEEAVHLRELLLKNQLAS